MVPPSSEELDTEALLETVRKDPAFRNLSKEELFLQLLKDKQAEASGGTRAGESNKVLQAKEWIWGDCDEAYICKYKGKNYYYADNLKDKNKFCQPISLKVGTNREAALHKARNWYKERGAQQVQGVFNKSINTKELFDLYVKSESYRIHQETQTGLIQESYDAKLQRLKYWTRYIDSLGHKNTKIENIPKSIGKQYKDWIYRLPKERYKDRPRDIQTINAIVGAAKAMYKYALDAEHIGHNSVPIFKRFDAVPDDDRIKRSVLLKNEWLYLSERMFEKYFRPIEEQDLPKAKVYVNRQFVLYLLLQYETGARMKELDELKWKQITEPAFMKGAMRDLNKDIYIPRSKTARQRTFTANVTDILNFIRRVHEDCGIPYDPEGRVFIKIENNPKPDEWFGREAIARFLKKELVDSGLQEKLDAEFPKRNITLNSARHYFATRAIVEWGWDYKTTSTHMGNSAHEIETRYSKHTSNMLTAARMKEVGSNPLAEKEILNEDGSIDKEETEQFQRQLRGLPRTKPPKDVPKPWKTKEEMDRFIERTREEHGDEIADAFREGDMYQELLRKELEEEGNDQQR